MSRFRTDHLVLPDTDLQAAAASTSGATSTPALTMPPPPPLPPRTSMGAIPSPRVPTSQHSLPSSAQAVQLHQLQGGNAAGTEPQQAASQDVQDAKALADSFLASLGLHASLAQPPTADPSASEASMDPSPAASRSSQQSQALGKQQLRGNAQPSREAASTAAAAGPGGDEVVAPDVVTAAALERRAALHKSIFEGDMESETDEEEEEEEGDAAPAPAAEPGTWPASAPYQPPPADPAALPTMPPAGTAAPLASRPGGRSSDESGGAKASMQQKVDDSSQSVLGLPTGMQNRPVFMSKKARLAQAAQQQAASAAAAPSLPAPGPAVQPADSRQQPLGPDRGRAAAASELPDPSAPTPGASGRRAAQGPAPKLQAERDPAGSSASADVIQPPGVPVGATGPSTSQHGDHQSSACFAAVDSASSSGSDEENDDSGRPETAGRSAGAGHSTRAHVLGPPPGMSAIQWQREQEAQLRGSSRAGKAKKRSKEKEKSKKHKHSHHKKHKHKSKK